MNDFKKYFDRFIQQNYPDEFPGIVAEVAQHYALIAPDTAFAKTSGNPIDQRMDFCAYFLALIKTLDKRGESFDTIRKICLDITIAYVTPKNKAHAYIKRLVPKLINTWAGQRLMKLFHQKISVNKSPEGFIANIITDKQETYGFGYGIDIIECGICKLFKKHHFDKYAAILCEVDEITSGFAGLTLIRKGTIANGAKICDFRFQPIKQL